MNASSKQSKPLSAPDLESGLDALFRRALDGGVFLGASILVMAGSNPPTIRNYGHATPGGSAVADSTRFDLASLTKPLVTVPLVMTAVARGMVGLDDPLDRFFPPDSVPSEKKGIRVRHLLSHSSGLPPYVEFFRTLIGLPPDKRKEALVRMIMDAPLIYSPGSSEDYSDLGYMLLGMILEQVFGARLDRLAEEILFGPLGVGALNFRPLRTGCDPAAVPPASSAEAAMDSVYAVTENCPWRKRLLRGEVDDENAWCLDGVAGHAGLFGTAFGVFSLVSSLWDIYRGRIDDPLRPRDLLRLFWTHTAPKSRWTLGFDTPSRPNSSSGRYFSLNSVGHLGFTGTSFWLDLEQELMVVLLTNRVYPSRENDRLKSFRPIVHDAVMEALGRTGV